MEVGQNGLKCLRRAEVGSIGGDIEKRYLHLDVLFQAKLANFPEKHWPFPEVTAPEKEKPFPW